MVPVISGVDEPGEPSLYSRIVPSSLVVSRRSIDPIGSVIKKTQYLAPYELANLLIRSIETDHEAFVSHMADGKGISNQSSPDH